MKSIATLYQINSDLFRKVLEMANSSDLHKRPYDKGNSFHWVVGHLTAYRFVVARLLGIKDEFPDASLFQYGAEPGDPAIYPSLEQIENEWENITTKMHARLQEVPDEVLAGESPFEMPGVERTVGSIVGFMQLHESYHIGQLAYINRLHGCERLMG
ncbi:MAG TPA: DinB family protein [Acidobacteriota bacterium]|nr:DinB family protein [Acidobacteriota bacterium]